MAEASGTLFASETVGAQVCKFAAVELVVAPWYKSWPQACGCARRPGTSWPDQSWAGESVPGQAQ